MTRRAANDETVAGVLKLALGVILTAGAVALAVGLLANQPETIAVAGACLLLNGPLLYLLSRGQVSLVALLTPLSVLIVGTGALLAGHGIHDEALVLFPLVLILGNLVASRRQAVLLMALAVAMPVLVGAAELAGLVETGASHLTIPGGVVVLGVMLIAVGAITRRFMDRVIESLHQAKSSDRSYREIFDSAGDPLFVHDPESGRILDVNQTMLDCYGLSHEEALAATPTQLTAPGEASDPKLAIERIQAAARGGSATFEWHARRKNGETFWTEVALKRAVIGDELRVLAVVRDISLRREAENRLRQAEKLQAVGQLAGGIAHDFNNQLTGILGNAELLSRRLEHDPQLKKFADLICRSATHSAELTQQLLAFARKGAFRRNPVELNALVAEVLQLVGRSFDKRFRIEPSLSPRPITTLGDPALLQNAILNLVLNARDAMPEGGRIEISTSVGEALSVEGMVLPAGEWARIAVVDSGVGLSADLRTKVFEPFFTTKAKGNGMGLAAVYGTARSHGGGVALESAPGKGARFTLCLPLHVGAASGEAEGVEGANAAAGESAPTPRRNLSARRVLIADDEEAVAEVTRKILEIEGWEVVVCSDGAEAVQRYEALTGALDLVILDLSMPRLSGTAALMKIRQREPELPAVMMTGYGNDTLQEELRRVSGRTEMLRKPFTQSRLLEVVAAACSVAREP